MMGILDWLRSKEEEPTPSPSGMSRRDFFARVAGQGLPPAPEPPPPDPDVLFTFHVARFPFHAGPVLVPILRPGLDFMLIPDPHHLTDPDAVKIQWGRDHLGYVPPEYSAEVRRRLKEGETLICRSVSVDPTAELPKVLRVEIRTPPPAEQEEPAAAEESEDSSGIR